MKKIILYFFLFVLINSCSKEKYFDGPEFYADDFENYNAVEEMLSSENINWSYTQITLANNNISIDTGIILNGTKSIKFDAEKSSSSQLSKCSVAKQKMAFYEGETVRVSVNYYLVGNNQLDWLFLVDLEEQAAIGAGPGMRIALVNNQLRIEYKFNEPDIIQNSGSEVNFPRNQWVQLVWEVKLSQKKKGEVRLYQDGVLIIDKKGIKTSPTDFLYSLQGTKGMYTSIEIGITANSYDNNCVLYTDDFKIEKI